MATSSRYHNGVKIEILQTLIGVFLTRVNFCRRKAFYWDGYDKTSELSNFKGNLVSHLNKLKDMSVELGSKKILSEEMEPSFGHQWYPEH